MLVFGEEELGVHMSGERRGAWRRLVRALQEAAAPGRPLADWAFHGTSREKLARICREGLRAGDVVMRDDEGEWLVSGTHWATPQVAAWYAEDECAAMGDPDLAVGFVAIRIADLEAEGPLVPDFSSVEFPIASRLGRAAEEVRACWQRSEGDWKASRRILGSFACLSPIASDNLHFVAETGDLENLLLALDHQPTGLRQ